MLITERVALLIISLLVLQKIMISTVSIATSAKRLFLLQVKVMTEAGLIDTACEQFLGQSSTHIQQVLLQTLDGHLRAIMGTMTVEAVFQVRTFVEYVSGVDG